MLSPLCESHSRQAASQARQPMQRDGSTNSVLIAIGIASCSERLRVAWLAGVLRLADARTGTSSGRSRGVKFCDAGRRRCRRCRACVEPLDRRAQALYSGILTVGSTAGLVSWLTALPVAVVERDEQRVGPDRRHDQRLQLHRRRAASARAPISSVAMPSRAAACGWISTHGSGAWLFRKPSRRVWLPLR